MVAQKSWLDLNNKFFFSKTGSTKLLLIDFATSYSKKVIGSEMCFSKKKN